MHFKLNIKKKVHLVEIKFDSCAPLLEIVCKDLKNVLMDTKVGMNVMMINGNIAITIWLTIQVQPKWITKRSCHHD